MKPIGRERDREIMEAKGVVGAKYWSTSIPDAWELWEELPMPKSFDHVYDGCFVTFYNGQNPKEVWGESFPDAVTQAWLTWKKGVRRRG